MNILKKHIVTVVASSILVAPAVQAKKPSADPESWYMQTIVMVESGSKLVYDDRSGVFGRIPGGQFGKDIHDIRAFENVAGSEGAIVMMTSSDSFGEDAGQYLSDYRAPGTDRQVWDFTVTSKLVGATVTLAWDGLYTISSRPGGGFDTELDNNSAVLKGLKLIDLSTGEVVSKGISGSGNLGSYTFVMDDSMQRQFRWVQGPVKGATQLSHGASTLSIPPASTLAIGGEVSGARTAGFPAPPSVGNNLRAPNSGNPESRQIEK